MIIHNLLTTPFSGKSPIFSACLLTLLLNFNTPALAKDPQLQQLFEIALAESPIIEIAQAQQNAAQGQQQLTESLKQPQVSFESELSYAWMLKKDFPRMANQLKITYPLYQPEIGTLQSIANHQEVASQWQLEAQRQQLMQKIANRYYQYWSQHAQVEYLAKERLAIENIIEQIQRRFQVGYQDLNDIAEIQARLDSNREQQLFAEQKAQTIEANLMVLVGKAVKLEDLQPPKNLPKQTQSTGQTWLKLAQNHPLIQQLQATKMAADKQIEIKQHEDGLKVNAFGGYVFNESEQNFYDDMQGLKGGVQISVPLYLGGRTEAKQAKAHAQSQQIQAQTKALMLELQSQATNSELSYQAGLKRLEALKDVLYSSKQALEATESGLRTGTRNILDLLNAQRRLHAAQRDIPMTKAQIWQAWYELQWAKGQLNSENI